jgi:hypothetical protein
MIPRKQERVADMDDLLSSVIAAHGGLDRWRTVRAIDVTFNFSGGLLDIKGFPVITGLRLRWTL